MIRLTDTGPITTFRGSRRLEIIDTDNIARPTQLHIKTYSSVGTIYFWYRQDDYPSPKAFYVELTPDSGLNDLYHNQDTPPWWIVDHVANTHGPTREWVLDAQNYFRRCFQEVEGYTEQLY